MLYRERSLSPELQLLTSLISIIILRHVENTNIRLLLQFYWSFYNKVSMHFYNGDLLWIPAVFLISQKIFTFQCPGLTISVHYPALNSANWNLTSPLNKMWIPFSTSIIFSLETERTSIKIKSSNTERH